VRVQLLAPVEGQQQWELQGVPRCNDMGDFAGFTGTARPLDDEEAALLAASLSAPTLQALPCPALVIRLTEGRWVLHQANSSAQAVWPTGERGTAMTEARGALPSRLLNLLVDHATPQSLPALPSQVQQTLPIPQSVEGWQIAAGGSPQTRLLIKLPDPAAPAATTDASEQDSFNFTLSHDLRTPIRVVEGFTRIVKEDYGRQLDRVGNDHLDRVLSAAVRMNLMIDAMLTLARLSQQPLARQRVNLSQVASYVVDDLRRGAPDRDAVFDIAPGLSCLGDPTLLRQVLENLLGNAWKYTSKMVQANIALHACPQGGKTGFVVRDNGAGFDMRSSDRLFSLFQRLHSASDFPGHGVGLASVRRIVQRHGGQIWAEAEPGRGAAFFFTLPD
jgi:signal transduction histidine kinase